MAEPTPHIEKTFVSAEGLLRDSFELADFTQCADLFTPAALSCPEARALLLNARAGNVGEQ